MDTTTQQIAPQVSDLDTMFQLQRDAFRRQPNPAAGERRAQLDAVCRLLLEHGDALAAAIDADFGHRSVHETRILEIFPALQTAKHAKAHVAQVDAARAQVGLALVHARSGPRGEATAGRGRHHRALELSALSRGGAVGLGAGGGQPGDGQDVRVHAPPGGAVRALDQVLLGTGPCGGRQWGCRRRAGFCRHTLRSPVVHRLHVGWASDHAHRGGASHTGDAGAGRQVTCHHRARLSHRRGGTPHHLGQVPERRADLHCARLRPAPRGRGTGLHRCSP